MSYHIYTTSGIILRRHGVGEANALLHVLTRDLGVIVASAQAVRVGVSKLRPAIQEYTHVSLSCVKGKNGWKVTSAVPKESFYFDFPEHTHKVVAQIASVLLKLIPGEESHPELFEIVLSGFHALRNISDTEVTMFESLMMLRILFELGYIEKNSETEQFLAEPSEWNLHILQVAESQSRLIALVNKGLKASQLV